MNETPSTEQATPDGPVLETWQTPPDAPFSPATTWQVLKKWQDIDLEMWTCRIVTPDKPAGEIWDCYAWYLQTMPGIQQLRQDGPESEHRA